jgi:hypothetical protein
MFQCYDEQQIDLEQLNAEIAVRDEYVEELQA